MKKHPLIIDWLDLYIFFRIFETSSDTVPEYTFGLHVGNTH